MSIVVNGSGTITGISTGGLPDGSVDVDTLAANSVTAAKIVDGTIVDAEVTSLAASKLTGALPAISGANLTGITLAALTDTTVSTSDPVITTNPSAVGHYWVNKTSGECYVCTDITSNNNVWKNIGDGAGEIAPTYNTELLCVAGGGAGGNGIGGGGGAGGAGAAGRSASAPGAATAPRSRRHDRVARTPFRQWRGS